MPGEWNWMQQSPMMMQALMSAGGMFGQQQQQPQQMFAPPQLPQLGMGRTTPIQAPPMPQTPQPMPRSPWWGQGMFS